MEKYKDLIKEYLIGQESITKLSKKYNYNRNSVSKYLKKIGIEIVNKQNLCKFDNKIFDSIDTEKKAYWLGFIYADGSVSDGTKNNNIEISLKLSDILHLEKFRKFTNCENNVKFDHFRCRFTLTNKYLRDKLEEIGCVPRKSLILKFPDTNIFSNKKLIKHFIRGYVDGDGCLTIINNKNPCISILGTTSFLEGLQKAMGLKKNRKLSKNNYSSSSDTMVLSFNGKSAVYIADYLYKDSIIYLDRKFEKYQKFLECRPKWKHLGLLSDENGEG